MPHSESAAKPKVLLLYRQYASSFTAYPWIFGRERKIEVHTLAPRSHAIRHSRWVDGHHTFDEPGGMIEALLDLLESGYDAMLCIDEPARELVLENRGNPLIRPYLPFPENSDLFEAAVNKVKFQQWCARQGLASPRSEFCATRDELESAAGEFDFPLILKGAHGAGGQQVHIVRNKDEFAPLIAGIHPAPGDEWIVQEYITGSVGTTLFVAGGGELYAHCSVINRVCMHGGIGPSAICEFIVAPELEAIAAELAKHMDGLTGVDWMRDAEGRFILIDPHFGRATPNAVIAHLGGVDFGQAFYRALTGARPEMKRPNDSHNQAWLMPKSLNLIFEGRLFEALRCANPFSRKVKIFWGGRGEWRLFLALTADVVLGNLRVLFGAARRRFLKT